MNSHNKKFGTFLIIIHFSFIGLFGQFYYELDSLVILNHKVDSIHFESSKAPLIIRNQNELDRSALLSCIEFDDNIDFSKNSLIYYYVPLISHKDSLDIKLYRAKYKGDFLVELNVYNNEKSINAISKSSLFLIPAINKNADISFIHKILIHEESCHL